MTKLRTMSLLTALALAAFGTAQATTQVGVSISISNAPPPPVIVVREPPRLVYVPEARLYMASEPRCDYDWFRVGMNWYIWDHGYWYRATSHRGPYRAIETRYVPDGVWRVPAAHWKRHPHGGPPGQMKKSAYAAPGHGHGHDGH